MYVIQCLSRKTNIDKLAQSLIARIQKDGRFRVNHLEVGTVKTSREDRRTLGKVWTMPAILMKGIRLTKKSSYCLQHPGECLIDPFTGKLPPKKNATFLDWDNWIAFHNLVNGLLNQRHASANVWTNPMELLAPDKKRMWIRRGKQARIKWEWETSYNNYGRRVQTWNSGTIDQFSP
jgi:hypothetical protein